jgi:MFS family permease
MSSFAVTDAAPLVIARRCAVLAGKRRSLPRLATFAVLYCVQPMMPGFARAFSISPAAASLSLSTATGEPGVAMLWAGTLSDAFGRKAVMTVSATTPSAATLAASFSPDWTTSVTLRALTGLALSGIPAVANAYLAEEMDRSAARRRFSRRSACILAIRASGISSFWTSC